MPVQRLQLGLVTRLLLLTSIAGLQVGCEVHDAKTAPRFWTLFDLDPAMTNGSTVATGETFRGGLPAGTFLEANGDGTTRPRVLPAFAEGQPAAYVVPEVWSHYEEIWLQPWYALVTAWDEKNPSQNRLKDADGKTTPPLYDVDVDSTFYSPFWKIIYAVVPPGTSPTRYTSTRDLLNDHVPLHDGAPWIYSMRPNSVTLGDGKPLHPILGNDVGNLSLGAGAWIAGSQKPYLNLGGNDFRYDAGLVVEPVALFWFVRRGAAPETAPALPAVIGTGPLGTRRPAQLVGNKPTFGGLCRLTIAVLPPTADAFDPEAHPEARDALTAAMINPAMYSGRVALNANKIAATDTACFADPTFPASCTWLDSQAAVEDRLGANNLTTTELLLTCPFVTWNGKAVK